MSILNKWKEDSQRDISSTSTVAKIQIDGKYIFEVNKKIIDLIDIVINLADALDKTGSAFKELADSGAIGKNKVVEAYDSIILATEKIKKLK